MPRSVKSHLLEEDAAVEGDLVAVTKAEFGRKLYQEIVSRGWNQSDLARRADLPRDAISTYIRGRSMPTPQSLAKLAKALGKAPAELLPNYAVEAVKTDSAPSFDLKVSAADPTKAWIRIDRLVSFDTAVKIAALLSAEPVSENKESNEPPHAI